MLDDYMDACKNTAITLGHLSQLLGYSRVALPQYSFIIAPQGASSALQSLLLSFGRIDILQYAHHPGQLSLSLVIGRWDEAAQCIDGGSLITGDLNRLGRL